MLTSLGVTVPELPLMLIKERNRLFSQLGVFRTAGQSQRFLKGSYADAFLGVLLSLLQLWELYWHPSSTHCMANASMPLMQKSVSYIAVSCIPSIRRLLADLSYRNHPCHYRTCTPTHIFLVSLKVFDSTHRERQTRVLLSTSSITSQTT